MNQRNDAVAHLSAREANGQTHVEFRVRPHTTYSVTRYYHTESPAEGIKSSGSETIASGLPLDGANDLAHSLGRVVPGAKITVMDVDDRQNVKTIVKGISFDHVIKMEQGLFGRLTELPPGSKITIWLDDRKEKGWAGKPNVADMRFGLSQVRELDVMGEPDVLAVNWSAGGLLWGEVEEIKVSLRDMPYPLAAAMRRNARAIGDATLIKLMDETEVAVDA